LILRKKERGFIEFQRVGRMASIDRYGMPHVLPICYSLMDESIVSILDEKPKKVPAIETKRIQNIIENSKVAVIFDHYDDHDWLRLGWVMVRGSASICLQGELYDAASVNLQARYHQYNNMNLLGRPIIVLQIETVLSWGELNNFH
jgi:PPOX class probable F420-dependent enzyme